MASMLEVMREYKHLTAKKRAEGTLPPPLEQRLAELEGVVKASRKSDGQASAGTSSVLSSETPMPRARSSGTTNPGVPNAATPRTTTGTTNPGMPLPRAASRAASAASAPARTSSDEKQRDRSRGQSRAEHSDWGPLPQGSVEPRKYSFLDLLALKLPKDIAPRILILAVLAAILMSIDVGMFVAIGVPNERATTTVLPMVLLIAGGGWFLIYPGLMLWRERVASSGNAHISEPDFEARIPKVEPIAAMMTGLGLVLYVWLGGFTTGGLGLVAGALFCLLFGMMACAIVAILAVRPIAIQRVRARGLRQYLEGGTYHLNKGNPKRARRLLERAMEEARGTPKANEIARHLRTAAIQEADELRKKGYTDRADELIRAQSARPGMELMTGWGDNQGGGSVDIDAVARSMVASMEGGDSGGAQTANDLLSSNTGPRLIETSEVDIDDYRAQAKPGSADEAANRERARVFMSKKRMREAFEVLVQASLPVTKMLAEEAAQAYISEGMLRSADAIFEALGIRQIPEFYKAVSAEWARDSHGDPPPEACLRLATILSSLGEDEPAARIACRGALSKTGSAEARQAAAKLGFDLCKKIEKEPPVELLEAIGDLANAARAYETEGRPEDAIRTYRACADQLMEKKEGPGRLIPVLSKLFLLDPNITDKYLDPLAMHVLETAASGPVSMKILVAYKKRKKSDDKLTLRMFQLFVDAQQSEEAWAELESLAKLTANNPEGCLKECRLFVDRFPEHLKARGQYVRSLLKLGRIDDAARQVHQYVHRAKEQNGDPKETIALLTLLLDWGHDDKELRKALGALRIDTGSTAEGLADLTRYVREGGRDPQIIAQAKDLLSENLALPSGGPNHEQLLKLGQFLLYSGDPEGAISHLEVARASKDHRTEANLYLAQAYVAAQQPKKAIPVLKEAIGGQKVKDALELNYELARAYEAAGMKPEADRINKAVTQANPEFALEYEKTRARFDRADTSFALEGDFEQENTNPTDVSAKIEAAQKVETETREREKETRETREKEPRERPKEHPALSALTPAPKVQEPAAGDPLAKRPNPRPPSISPMSPDKDGESEPGHLGDTLLPRYRLLRKIGAGGMGEVHLAEDTDLGRYVAIKVLRRSLATDLFLAKFKEEARIVAQLQHPNIVAIYDLGQKGAWSYIVMEYVDGFDLATLVNKSGGFERKRLIRIIAATAEAMSYAHSRGVIHRDLKPANILVGQNDSVKVTDFGIAKVLQPDGGQETAFSAAGLQVGTVNYMAPEQIRGSNVDPRTDLYLLGTTLYVCLTGAFPFQGDAVAFQKLRDDPASARSHVNSISIELDACLMKCLARKPEDRYPNMLDFAAAVRKVPEVVGRR